MQASNFDKLLVQLGCVHDLTSADSLLGWDENTLMPAAGSESRGFALGTLRSLRHELLTGKQTQELLTAAEAELSGADPESDQVAMVQKARFQYERASKLSASLVAEEARLISASKVSWARAKTENAFPLFQPHLKQIIDLVRKKAQLYGYSDHPYDALLPDFEPGMTTAQLRTIFADLKARLVPLIRTIAARGTADDSVLRRRFAPQRQLAFCRKMVQAIGLDSAHGRLDTSEHPFMTGISSPHDVRITMRNTSRFSILDAMHEAGHGLYELGLNPAYARTPLATIASCALHESQSRTWENIVGRSREFWTHWYPQLQKSFPTQLRDVAFETFYAALNKVSPSFIRTESDEVYYNLHIILRFELEVDLIAGAVEVDNVANVWNDRFESMFGIRPPNDRLGVLQDVHWCEDLFAYFPSYALGNLIGAQLFEQALIDLPVLKGQIANGQYRDLRQWQAVKVHQFGDKYTPNQLVRRVTGKDIGAEAFIRYLSGKYAA